MRKKIKSPCIDVCKLKNDVCVGCGRTSYQIRNWSKFRSNKRDQIIQQLKSKNYRCVGNGCRGRKKNNNNISN